LSNATRHRCLSKGNGFSEAAYASQSALHASLSVSCPKLASLLDDVVTADCCALVGVLRYIIIIVITIIIIKVLQY